jgi:hypothetical protein
MINAPATLYFYGVCLSLVLSRDRPIKIRLEPRIPWHSLSKLSGASVYQTFNQIFNSFIYSYYILTGSLDIVPDPQ